MSDILIEKRGRAGRVTLNRPKALNALTYPMLQALDAALIDWAADDTVDIVVIDAAGEKAFCAGGDIADLYEKGRAGDFGYGRQFWQDEYRMNLRIGRYPKPVVSLMQGFTMGGGVGVSCHASHRIVGESAQIAMPEVGIGLVPDVGGSLLLARAPGRLGAYLALTAARMGAGDAIYAGFADHYVPQQDWPAVIAALEDSGTPDVIPLHSAPAAQFEAVQNQIDTLFAAPDLPGLVAALTADDSEFASKTLDKLRRNSPLGMACALHLLASYGPQDDLAEALRREFRFTTRASEHADFLEGIRAAIIDKDRTPNWRHGLTDVPQTEIDALLAPLPDDQSLTF